MTDEELQTIEQRAANATPGPWTTEAPKMQDGGWAAGVVIAATYGAYGIFAKSGKAARVYADPPEGQMPAADQTFIAHAREDVPALVAEVKRLRHEVLAEACQRLARIEALAGKWLQEAVERNDECSPTIAAFTHDIQRAARGDD